MKPLTNVVLANAITLKAIGVLNLSRKEKCFVWRDMTFDPESRISHGNHVAPSVPRATFWTVSRLNGAITGITNKNDAPPRLAREMEPSGAERFESKILVVWLPAEHLCHDENYRRANQSAAHQHVDQRITSSCEQNEAFHDYSPAIG